MWKKLSMILMACTIAFSFSAAGTADAAKYKSPKKSYSPSNGATTTTPNAGVNKADPAASKSPAAGTAATPQKRGFFSGGGLMKGLMIGGLAGLLFGGLFGGLGILGNILGFLVNMVAIVALIAIAARVFIYFRDRKKFKEEPRRY
ncbi:hypothetical protein ACP26L_15185 [Paenibacillus sp. S-38]|uniref:hypothetical protein n=1 Tax=Paenibacillus sp. S-38 TaxID=3416710 RepID=UPI003CEEB42A